MKHKNRAAGKNRHAASVRWKTLKTHSEMQKNAKKQTPKFMVFEEMNLQFCCGETYVFFLKPFYWRSFQSAGMYMYRNNFIQV